MVYPAAWVQIPLAPPYGTLAQWSVPPAHNRSYAGSNPARSTKRAAASGELAPSVTSGSKKAQSGKPDTNHPAGKTVLQHRTPVISERLSKSAGFCDRQSLQLRWDDFFLWCLALHGVSYSRQSPWYLQASPSRHATHTASRSYPED